MLNCFLSVLLSLGLIGNGSTSHVRDIYMRMVRANHLVISPLLYETDFPIKNAFSHYSWFISTVTIHRGWVKFAKNDAEIAWTLGHELAHIKFKHHHSTWNNEYAADKLGLFYAQQAGYPGCHGAAILKRLSKEGSKDHPPGWLRYKRLCGDK